MSHFSFKSFLIFCFCGKVIEFVERSKDSLAVDSTGATAENVMMGVSEEEMYNIPTAEYAYRRGGFINRQLTIYHVALHACADLKNVEVLVNISAYLLILLVKKNQILPAPMHVCDCSYKFWY